MNIVFRVLGGLLLVLLPGWSLFSSAGDSLGVFVNIPSALLVLGMVAGGMLRSFEPARMGCAIEAVFRRGAGGRGLSASAGEPDGAYLSAGRHFGVIWPGGYPFQADYKQSAGL